MSHATHSRRETAYRAARVTAAVLAVLMLLGPMLTGSAVAQTGETEPCAFGPSVPGQNATDSSNASDRLRIDTRPLFEPGATHPYEVVNVTHVADPATNDTETLREDVTENATLTSSNSSVLSVNETGATLVATDDPDTATWVRVDASTANRSGCTNVIVAEPTVENLELVPGIHRVEAVAGDSTLFALLIATLLAVPAARFTSAFGGLAVAQMTLVVGWFAGYVGFGTAAASLFVALFIGLNLAANIDYSAGRLSR